MTDIVIIVVAMALQFWLLAEYIHYRRGSGKTNAGRKARTHEV